MRSLPDRDLHFLERRLPAYSQRDTAAECKYKDKYSYLESTVLDLISLGNFSKVYAGKHERKRSKKWGM
jgi:hypothetical protein